MKFIHVLFVIGTFINPVIAEDHEDEKMSIENNKYTDVINSYPKAVREGYCKAKLLLNLEYNLKIFKIEDFLSCSKERE